MGEVPSDAAKGLPLPDWSGPGGVQPQPPRMTSRSIEISSLEYPEVQRFLSQMRAQRSMEAGGGNQDIAGIANEFMKRQLRLIRKRIEGMTYDPTSVTHLHQNILAILDEHIQALE